MENKKLKNPNPNPNYNEVFCKRLTELREDRGWSKTDVAALLGKSLTSYANWEYGLRDPNTKVLSELAKLFSVSIDYLLGLTDNKISDVAEQEFLSDISSSELKRWMLEMPNYPEEDLIKLRTMWELVKSKEK